jgi:hypothetical protein
MRPTPTIPGGATDNTIVGVGNEATALNGGDVSEPAVAVAD